MTVHPAYPFAPKSNRFLLPGQFWAIHLVSDQWACGRVLGIDRDLTHGRTVTFIAGILDWVSDDRPTAESIGQVNDYIRPALSAHIRNITDSGGTIDGWCDLDEPNLSIQISGDKLFHGGRYVRERRPGDRSKYEFMGAINLGGLRGCANQVFAGVEPATIDELRERYERARQSKKR